MDIYAKLKNRKTGKKYGVVVEVKDRKKAVSSTEAQKLLEAAKAVKAKYGLEGMMVLYLSENAPFSKPAGEMLKKARAMYGTSKNVLG